MDGIDEVSARIGALEATTTATKEAFEGHKQNAKDRHKEAMDKLDKVIELQMQTNGRVSINETKIEEIEKEGGKLDSAYKNGKDWKNTKLKALGAVFGLGVAGGGIGTALPKWLKFLQ